MRWRTLNKMGSKVADHSVHRYGGVAQLFHWLIAIMIFVMFGLGWYMTDLETSTHKFEVYQIHKGIGVTILVLALFRLLWRLTHKTPPLPETMKGWERLAASGAHVALYGLIFLQPVIGILQSNAANFPIVLWGGIELPALIGPDQAIEETLVGLHHLFAELLALLVLVHIGAALRHHIMLKDDILRRMLPGAAVGTAVVVLAFGLIGPFFLTADQAAVRSAAVATPAAPAVTNITPETTAEPATSAAPEVTDITPDPPAAPTAETASDQAAADTSTGAGGAAWGIEAGSALGFIAQQQGSAVPGNFEAFDAEILFDPEDLDNSRLNVEIDTTSIATGHNDRDQMLNSPSFFDTKQWPSASFKSTKITAAGDGQFEALAQLTIRDVTKEVILPFTLEVTADPADPAKQLAHAKGELPIMRLDYGIGQGDWASTATVADEVVITIDIKASRTKE